MSDADLAGFIVFTLFNSFIILNNFKRLIKNFKRIDIIISIIFFIIFLIPSPILYIKNKKERDNKSIVKTDNEQSRIDAFTKGYLAFTIMNSIFIIIFIIILLLLIHYKINN
jgi:hypothetical protein